MKTNLAPAIVAALALWPIGGGAWAASAPPHGGTIALQSKVTDGAGDMATTPFMDAASSVLAAKGFTMLQDADHAAYVGELIVSRADVGTGATKIPAEKAAVMPGAPGGAGAGVSVPLSMGASRLAPLQRTSIELRIRKRGEPAPVWDGAASTVRAAGARRGTDDAVATDLTQAMLRGYPAAPEGIVGVP